MSTNAVVRARIDEHIAQVQCSSGFCAWAWRADISLFIDSGGLECKI